MSLTVLNLYGSSSGGNENAIANLDIPDDGTIMGVDWAISGDMDADSEFWVGELSFIATFQGTTNDSRGVLSMARSQISITTSGIAVVSINKYVPIGIQVSGGERLYLNVQATAGVTALVNALVQLDTTIRRPRRSRRRT